MAGLVRKRPCEDAAGIHARCNAAKERSVNTRCRLVPYGEPKSFAPRAGWAGSIRRIWPVHAWHPAAGSTRNVPVRVLLAFGFVSFLLGSLVCCAPGFVRA